MFVVHILRWAIRLTSIAGGWKRAFMDSFDVCRAVGERTKAEEVVAERRVLGKFLVSAKHLIPLQGNLGVETCGIV
jgi:hypothetical protein